MTYQKEKNLRDLLGRNMTKLLQPTLRMPEKKTSSGMDKNGLMLVEPWKTWLWLLGKIPIPFYKKTVKLFRNRLS
jgi:hypothetical protein